ncbi:MAG: ATP-binding protein [Granulosicoccus sp.]
MTRPVKVDKNRPTYQLGFYTCLFASSGSDTGAYHSEDRDRFDASQQKLPANTRLLSSLSEELLEDVHCIIVDIRQNTRQVLLACRDAAGRRPVIVLADSDQIFHYDYPYGTYVSDVTSLSELDSSLFWHRVDRAVRAYDMPLSLNDTHSPIYSVFKAIADQTSDWIIVKDLQHRFVVAGEHFAATAGTSIEKIIGYNDLEIGSSEEAVLGNPETGEAGFWAQDDAVTDSARATVEENPEWLLYSRKARYRRTYRVPLKNPAGHVFALLVCSQDITEQVRNAELLGERTNMLEQVTDEKRYAEASRKLAEDAVAAKTRFLAAASHDLRQPLHAIGLFLDSLEKCVAGRDEYYLVQQIKQSCTGLGSLFNSCLDISRLDAGVVERKMEHFTAAGFLENLREEFRRQATEKSLNYRLVVDDSVVYSDQILLARVVRNLLNNAIQNTNSGCISIECQRHASSIEMRITDTGSGIASEELDCIFDEFHQVYASDARHRSGLGLGLSIVKRLCDLLDIKVKLDSVYGQGSQFTLQLPIGEQALGYPAAGQTQAVNLPEGLLVVIIEDNKSIRVGMEVLLSSYGCKTLCAGDTDEALRLLKTGSLVPDIIVADYHLSTNKTGTQAILDLRVFLQTNVPAILVTGDTSLNSEREAAVQQLPVLHKPVDSDELLATISNEVRQNAPEKYSRSI